MAGMLPGVEAARRRRFHHTNVNSEVCTTRRLAFCLHAISTYQSHSNSSMRNVISSQQVGLGLGLGDEDDENRLCAAAREAKKRLDHRFQPHYTSHPNSVLHSKPPVLSGTEGVNTSGIYTLVILSPSTSRI